MRGYHCTATMEDSPPKETVKKQRDAALQAKARAEEDAARYKRDAERERRTRELQAEAVTTARGNIDLTETAAGVTEDSNHRFREEAAEKDKEKRVLEKELADAKARAETAEAALAAAEAKAAAASKKKKKAAGKKKKAAGNTGADESGEDADDDDEVSDIVLLCAVA